MTTLLALDTCTELCSVAVLKDGSALAERCERAGQRHSRLLLQMVDDVLAESGLSIGDCDAIAFGRGPGSFTGIRIGAAAVFGLATGSGLRVVPVSTLAAVAQGCVRRDGVSRVFVALDARMGQVYWGAYAAQDGGQVVNVGGEHLSAPGEVALPDDSSWFGAGSGWGVHGEVLAAALRGAVTGAEPDRGPQAVDIARLAWPEVDAGRTVDAGDAVLVYLRDQVAVKSAVSAKRS